MCLLQSYMLCTVVLYVNTYVWYGCQVSWVCIHVRGSTYKKGEVPYYNYYHAYKAIDSDVVCIGRRKLKLLDMSISLITVNARMSCVCLNHNVYIVH